MLPNKFVAKILVGLLLAQALAMGVASAQSSGPDLRVVNVDVGTRVVGVDAPVTIFVQNVGNRDMPATGWQMFIGFNGFSESDCIELGVSGMASTGDCYQRFYPGHNMTGIPAGQTRSVTFFWNASSQQATTPTNRTELAIELLNLGQSPGTSRLADGTCNGPDTPNCMDNQVLWPITVNVAGVRATPDRNPESASVTTNTPWRWENIAEVCPRAPAPIKNGCKAVPGELYVATFIVTNLGNAVDTFVPTVIDLDGIVRERNLELTLPQPARLAPGASTEARVSLFLPANDTFLETINVNGTPRLEVRWRSTLNPSVDTDRQDNPGCQDNDNELIKKGICQDPSFPSIITWERRAFNVSTNYTWRPASAGKVATFNFTINNTGNADDEFLIEFDRQKMQINDSWVFNATLPGIVAPDKRGEASVTIIPPANATNGTYHFDILVRSKGDRDGSARCQTSNNDAQMTEDVGACRLTLTAHLEQRFDIDGRADVPVRTVPGEPQTFTLTIINSGNGMDNVTLDMQPTVGGWDPRLSDRILQIPAFGSRTFTLTVTPPPNTLEGTEGWFYVNATSEGPRDLGFDQRDKAPALISRVTVLRGPNIQLSAPVNTSYIDAGDSVEYDVVVTNTGNVADKFNFSVERQHPDWSAEATPQEVSLNPLQQATVRVRVTAPASAAVGEKTSVQVNALSTVDASKTRHVTLEGRVSGPDLAVGSINVNATSPYSGDPLTLSVTLRNDGNKAPIVPAKLRIYFVQGGVERVIAERNYAPTQLPGQRQLGDTFSWDTSEIEGSGVLVARIDVDNAVTEIDESTASNEASRPITLRTFDIRIVPADGLSARPGETIEYSESPHAFLVEYRGNQPDEPVTIRFHSEHGWLASDATGISSEFSVRLPRGSPLPVIARLDIPAIPGAAKDRLTIEVVPQLRPESVVSASTETTILDGEKPRVERIVATPGITTLGDRVTIEARVIDATGLSSVRAVVLLPTNETVFVPLEHAGDDRYVGEQGWSIAGDYRIAVEAIDNASPPNENRTRDYLGGFRVNPGSAPSISLAPGQPTTIRTGAVVKLNITDPLGIGGASYAIKGVSYAMRGPDWQIDTSTLGAGQVVVTVTAENIYGVATSETFTLTVHNTPPEIKSIVMSPEEPKVNEQVTLRIVTAADVAAVEVLLKRDGQVLATHQGVAKGAGVFEVTFSPEQGAYTVDVSAKDAAGNVQLSTGAVTFSARPDSPFGIPAPGFALVALALAGLALVARRRRG